MLDLPELKIVKPSDTRWLSQEKCVKAVKKNYTEIVTGLDNIHEQIYEPETLGISNVLRKKSTVSFIFLLDYTSCPVAKAARHYKQYKWI